MYYFREIIFFFLIHISILIKITTCKVDDTLNGGAFGKDVVDAVLRKIDKSQVFPKDNRFLVRLAFVESHFGTDTKTFRDSYYGGIWQVDESVFRATQSYYPSITKYYGQIQAKFNIDWKRVNWKNLTIPLYSGIAAALFFASVGESIPEKVTDQALYWRKHYRRDGNIRKFENDALELRRQTTCRGKLDLCIVLDSSGSIGTQNYEIAKDFIANVIGSLTLDFTRIGMLIYSSTVQDVFLIENRLTIQQMQLQTKSVRYLASSTRTDLGIFRGIEMFKQAKSNDGIPKLLIVLTDGHSDTCSQLKEAVQAIRDNNVKSVSIGIGIGINREELYLIALNDSRSVFQLSDFTSLQDFFLELTSITCEAPQKPEINAVYKDTLVRNEKRIYQAELPREGINVSVEVTRGRTRGYWSMTEEVPSSAVNDGILNGSTFIPAPNEEMMPPGAEPDIWCGVTLHMAIEGVDATNDYTIRTMEVVPVTTTTTTTEAITTTTFITEATTTMTTVATTITMSPEVITTTTTEIPTTTKKEAISEVSTVSPTDSNEIFNFQVRTNQANVIQSKYVSGTGSRINFFANCITIAFLLLCIQRLVK